MRTRIYTHIGALITGAIITLMLLKGCEEPVKPKVVYDYKTDTLFVDKPFAVHDTLTQVAPPRIVKVYIDTGSTHTIVDCQDGNIKVVDTISNQVDTLDNDFLTKFPRSQKLIELKLSMDSMEITLMNTKAKVMSRIYPMDFSHYRYQFLSDSLYYDEIPKVKTDKKFFDQHGLFAGGSYSVFDKTPLVNLSYLIQRKRLLGEIEATSSVENVPKLNLYLKLKYRITK